MHTGLPVLIVDPDAASAKLLAVVLRGEGADARMVSSAEDALQLLETFRPRVLIAELVLPLMSGSLLAQQLSADPAHRGLLLIAVSAVNGPAAERAARAAGFTLYVRKPIDATTFAGLLAQHLRATP